MKRVLMIAVVAVVCGCSPTVKIEAPVGTAEISREQAEKFDVEAFRAEQQANFEAEQLTHSP